MTHISKNNKIFIILLILISCSCNSNKQYEYSIQEIKTDCDIKGRSSSLNVEVTYCINNLTNEDIQIDDSYHPIENYDYFLVDNCVLTNPYIVIDSDTIYGRHEWPSFDTVKAHNNKTITIEAKGSKSQKFIIPFTKILELSRSRNSRDSIQIFLRQLSSKGTFVYTYKTTGNKIEQAQLRINQKIIFSKWDSTYNCPFD